MSSHGEGPIAVLDTTFREPFADSCPALTAVHVATASTCPPPRLDSDSDPGIRHWFTTCDAGSRRSGMWGCRANRASCVGAGLSLPRLSNTRLGCGDRRLMIGQPGSSNGDWVFGGGFTLIADSLGWDCIGVESESTLIGARGGKPDADCVDMLRDLRQRRTPPLTRRWTILPARPPELIRVISCPACRSASRRSEPLPSSGTTANRFYRSLGLNWTDFLVVYSYPWAPVRTKFHESGFDRDAARGAVLGPVLWPQRCASMALRYRGTS